MLTAENISIEVETILMTSSRMPKDFSQKYLVNHEDHLRRSAYKNTTIKVDDSFFDDSDMRSQYYLTVVYDKMSKTPLLSSRYYFDEGIIAKCLKGDDGLKNTLIYKEREFIIRDHSSVFLADRLSGNISNSLYRKNRSKIFFIYYNEIVKKNPDGLLLLMVRKEKGDKQLTNYIKMGFHLIGSTLHKGKEHSIILGDLKTWKVTL